MVPRSRQVEERRRKGREGKRETRYRVVQKIRGRDRRGEEKRERRRGTAFMVLRSRQVEERRRNGREGTRETSYMVSALWAQKPEAERGKERKRERDGGGGQDSWFRVPGR